MGATKRQLKSNGAPKKSPLKPKVQVELEESESASESGSEPESESESEREENLDDLDGDDGEIDDEIDDFDVADVSSNDEASSDEEEAATGKRKNESDSDESADELPKLKKKKNLDDGSESFANAFNSIIGSRLKAYDRKDPILVRNKRTLKKLESDKLEAKAKKLLLKEKKELQDKHRIKNLLPSADKPELVRDIIENERKMKKTAQKGVVRLFNAVLSTQIKTNQHMSGEKVGQTKKEELMNEISKEKFLDLVQAAGKS